jgi:hypothetical protein
MSNVVSSDKKRLRVGLLLDSLIQPRWRYRVIEEVATSSVAEIVLVVKNGAAAGARRSLVRSAWEQRRNLLYRAYTKLDDRLFGAADDAFGDRSVEGLVGGCPTLEVRPLMKKYTDYFEEQDLAAILGHELDVALRFGFRILKGGALGIAKHGVWSYHHGDGMAYRGTPPGLWEVMKGDPVTGSMLQVLTEELDGGKVIYRSWSPTINRFSVRRNNNNSYWKSSAFVMRKLKELHERGGEVCPDQCEAPYRPYFRRLYKSPTNSEMLPLALNLAGRAVSRAWEKATSFEQWFVAYRFRTGPTDANNSFHKFKHLVPPRDRFWADPFPISERGKYFIFLEEFLYETGKAHVSVFEGDGAGGMKAPVKVLERECHLSYPFVFKWRGDHYMIPETAANNTVELYRSASFPFDWKLEKVLLEGRSPADATLVEVGGLWYMFVCMAEEGVAVNWDELHLYYAESPLGPWRPHRRNPVKSDVRRSRPAGRLFDWNGALYRPAQNCSARYGYGLSLNRVERLSPDEFREEEVSTILPEWDRRVVGTHTLNSCGDLTVIDCLMQRRKFF